MRALILAGHGSHLSPETAGVVWSYVDQLRQWRVADEITACFWKETPAFNQVLDTIESEQVTVVPLFAAAGYFSQTVVPTEMGLDGPVTKRNGRTIRYTRTIGEHPVIAEIVFQRVTDTLQSENLDPLDVAVAIIGHGSPRNAHSQDTTRQQVATLRGSAFVAEVVAAYLDDDPNIASIFETTSAPNIIAVPFFLAEGSHTTRDVPAALRLAPGQPKGHINGRQIFYTPPIGIHQTTCHLILDLAHETGQSFEIEPEGNEWKNFPRYGSDELQATVQAERELQFGELRIAPTEVRPTMTENDNMVGIIESPAALRKAVRENPFRPLATSTGLPTGWRVPVTASHTLPAIIETIYPGAIADWAHNRRDAFRVQTLQEISERQTGMFRSIHKTDDAVIAEVVDTVCGHCVRHPTWFFCETSFDDIPCQAPCNWWLSRAKEAT